ncbi:MAG: hypothetical protein WBJ23_02525, partial [Anaerolineaceae bacterium]
MFVLDKVQIRISRGDIHGGSDTPAPRILTPSEQKASESPEVTNTDERSAWMRRETWVGSEFNLH